MAKWLLAYILTLIIFPRIKPYVKDIIDNEYILDIALGISIFIIIIFFILLINKGINHFIEIGPGKVLSGLVKRINKNVKINTINSDSDIKDLNL